MTVYTAKLKSPALWDQVLVGSLFLYCTTLFIPRVTAIERTGLVIAILISLFNGRWKACLPYLKHPILLLTYLFIAWQALTSFWSLDPELTIASVKNIFKDYFLVLPPLFYTLSTPKLREQFFKALAYGSIVIILINGWQYIQEYLQSPELLKNFKLHRGWGHPLLFLLPFVMLQVKNTNGRERWFWNIMLIVAAFMLMGTGARAAWLAVAGALIIWFSLDFTLKRIGIAVVSLAIIGGLSYFTIPFVHHKVQQGFDTNGRVGGVWTAATDMINDHPILGYGFSKEVYNIEFNRRVDNEPTWSIKRAIGPHSNYLEIAHASGLIGMGILIALYCTAIGYAAVWLRAHPLDPYRFYCLASLASFVAFYVIRGGFESVRWSPMIVLLCMQTYFSASGKMAPMNRPGFGGGSNS